MIKPKLLVITDILPSKQMTAGNVLSLIHREAKISFEIIYICLHNLELDYQVFDQVGKKSVYIVERPLESWDTSRFGFYSKVINFIGEIISTIESFEIARGIENIISRESPQKIMYIIESKTSVRVSWKLQQKNLVESIGVYWDPLEWWMESRKTSKFFKKILHNKNKDLIKKFTSIIVPSDNMKENMKDLGAKAVTTLYPYYEN
jgi:hypothetical protein